MSVHAPSRQLFRGEIASLVLVVLQAAFSHAAIVFLDRAKVVVVDWRRSASMAKTHFPFCGRGAPFSVVAVATEACLVCPAVASEGRTVRAGCVPEFCTGRIAGRSPGRQLVRSDLVDNGRCLWLLKARYIRGVEATGHRGVVRAAHARIFEEAARMPQLGVYDVDSKSIRRAKSIAGKQQMAPCGYRNSVSSTKGYVCSKKVRGLGVQFRRKLGWLRADPPLSGPNDGS